MTYAPAPAQQLFPARTWTREVTLQVASVLLLAALARVTVPWVPVPFTGQTLGVLLIGGWLGFRRGVTATAFYLVAGSLGAPVFAGGAAGAHVLLGPTGGYLVGFVVSAGTAGLLGEHGFFHTLPKALLAMVLATIPVFAVGLGWLAYYLPSGSVLAAGLWPFLPGALVKMAIAALALHTPRR